jgi:serine/threonine protein kinase
MTTLQSGFRIGTYQILSPLGAGGMGQVYRARDVKLERQVALKVLPEKFASDAERISRFQREARVLASLNHPHIAQIYGLEESGGISCLVLELVEGDGLDRRLEHGPIPIEEALEISRQIALGLETAHERGILHRDLKPANVKLTAGGSVKILDFGLAKIFETGRVPSNLSESPTLLTEATRSDVLLGTPSYMSPEQVRGKPTDERSDVWAFGCVLYELLTGKQAFSGDSVAETMGAITKADPAWSALPPETSPNIQRLLRRCLQKDPARRLHHIADARIEIEEALSDPIVEGAVPPVNVVNRRSPTPWLAEPESA